MKWLFALSLLATPACANTEETDRAAIAAHEAVWHSGADGAELEAMLAEDFHRTMPNGDVWDRERQLAWLRDRPPPPPGFTTRFEGAETRIDGDTATVTGIAVLLAPNGQEADRTSFTDVYARRGGRWLMVSAERRPAPRS